MAAKTAAKSKEPEELDGAPEADAPASSEGPAQPTTAKRSIGAKEPIIFMWKLLGTSDGVILTLFKAVEREEIEAHLERVAKEGYYTDLRIVDANEKVVQTKPPIPIAPEKPSARSKKAAKPVTVKKPKTVRISKRATPAPKKKAPPKKASKAKPAAKRKKK